MSILWQPCSLKEQLYSSSRWKATENSRSSQVKLRLTIMFRTRISTPWTASNASIISINKTLDGTTSDSLSTQILPQGRLSSKMKLSSTTFSRIISNYALRLKILWRSANTWQDALMQSKPISRRCQIRPQKSKVQIYSNLILLKVAQIKSP